MKHGQGNKPGEPEQHRQRIQTQDGELVGETREVGGCKSEVRNGDDHGPDGAEKEEADRVGGVVEAGIAVVKVCD